MRNITLGHSLAGCKAGLGAPWQPPQRLAINCATDDAASGNGGGGGSDVSQALNASATQHSRLLFFLGIFANNGGLGLRVGILLVGIKSARESGTVEIHHVINKRAEHRQVDNR